MHRMNVLPKKIQSVGERMSGTREESEYKAHNAPQEVQNKVKDLLKASPSFSSLEDAVKQAMKDRETEQWSHVVASWDDNAEKFWVIRENDPNYKYVCFSGLRFVVPSAAVDIAWEALTTDSTDTIEEV